MRVIKSVTSKNIFLMPKANYLPPLPSKWQTLVLEFLPELNSVLDELNEFLSHEEEDGKTLYPPKNAIFKALELSDPDKVKVVILGQDPYHGENQAMGLSFSVPEDTPIKKLPPSLKNIFKERESDFPEQSFNSSGDLTHWANQGVLLLNTVLTVEAKKAGSHRKKGWEKITSAILEGLNKREGIVFILWGAPAQKLGSKLDKKKHFLIESVHPSPLSSYRGFFGSRPFSKANEYLTKTHRTAIHW